MTIRKWIVPSLAAALALGTAIQCHIESGDSVIQPVWLASIAYGVALWFWWAILSGLLWQTVARRPELAVVSIRNVLANLPVALVLAFAHLWMLRWVIHLLILQWPQLQALGYGRLSNLTPGRIGLEMLLYMVTWVGCAAVHLQVTKQKEALQTAELRQQLSLAQLRALQMQLQPHFLFNTLNALTTLVELGRRQEAVEILTHLNAILKSTLVRETAEKVPLARELETVESYLAIEQIRFADRFRVELSIDPRALDGLVPCFLLQPIVENAIRHGISQVDAEGVVRACVERRGDCIHMLVRDNGPGKSQRTGHGIGLRNAEDRLARLYPRKYVFSSGAAVSGGFEVAITIPYERTPA